MAHDIVAELLDTRQSSRRPGGLMPTDASKLARQTRETATLLNCLGNEARLTVVRQLATEGEMSVGELSGRTGYSITAISLHLKLLRMHDLVEVRRIRRKSCYSLKGGFDGIAHRVQTALDLACEVSERTAAPKQKSP
jgi:DNA-binding transcriptional ArsR family regulator